MIPLISSLLQFIRKPGTVCSLIVLSFLIFILIFSGCNITSSCLISFRSLINFSNTSKKLLKNFFKSVFISPVIFSFSTKSSYENICFSNRFKKGISGNDSFEFKHCFFKNIITLKLSLTYVCIFVFVVESDSKAIFAYFLPSLII